MDNDNFNKIYPYIEGEMTELRGDIDRNLGYTLNTKTRIESVQDIFETKLQLLKEIIFSKSVNFLVQDLLADLKKKNESVPEYFYKEDFSTGCQDITIESPTFDLSYSERTKRSILGGSAVFVIGSVISYYIPFNIFIKIFCEVVSLTASAVTYKTLSDNYIRVKINKLIDEAGLGLWQYAETIKSLFEKNLLRYLENNNGK